MSNETLGWLLSIAILVLSIACLIQYRVIKEWRNNHMCICGAKRLSKRL